MLILKPGACGVKFDVVSAVHQVELPRTVRHKLGMPTVIQEVDRVDTVRRCDRHEDRHWFGLQSFRVRLLLRPPCNCRQVDKDELKTWFQILLAHWPNPLTPASFRKAKLNLFS